jgi:tRNA (guanine-N7-)-methyltransferase
MVKWRNHMTLKPEDFIITRKRKKYKFALFHNSPLCFEFEEWPQEEAFDVLEMGAGTGLFSVALAGLDSAKYVAVDVKADRLQKGAYAAKEAGRDTIRFLRARADQLELTIPSHTLKKIWVTFPDPFPRERSQKHRLTHPRYLKLYQLWLRVDGALYFKTDATSLFTWSLEQLVAEGWRIEELTFDLHESDLSDEYKLQTTYEARYISEGKPISFVRATPPRG